MGFLGHILNDIRGMSPISSLDPDQQPELCYSVVDTDLKSQQPFRKFYSHAHLDLISSCQKLSIR